MIIRSKSKSTIQRPFTAETNKNHQNQPNQQSIQAINRKILSNLIPDLSSLSNKNSNSNALLYSKFIMKDVNKKKVDLVKQSFNMKKETLQYEKKNTINLMKTLKTTVKSTKNTLTQQSFLKQNQEKTKNHQFFHFQENNQISSTTEVQKSREIQPTKKQTPINQPNDTSLNKIFSEKIFKRPKTAVSTPHTFNRTARAKTAKNKQSKNDCKPSTLDFNDSDLFETERKASNLMKIQYEGRLFINHIQRNKRLLSANSNKNSVYLTGIDPTQNENDDPKKALFKEIMKRQSPEKHKQTLIEDLNEDEDENGRSRIRLTQREIRQINEKNRINAEFMKKHMPQQYKKYIAYLQMKQNNLTEKDRALLSISLDRNSSQFEQTNPKLKDSEQALEEAKEYYRDYSNACDRALHFVNLQKIKDKKTNAVEEILNVEVCQQLLRLQHQRNAILQGGDVENIEGRQRMNQIKKKMRILVRNLHFFKQKPSQICKKIFNLNFSISTIQQEQIIISKGSEVNLMYVILNGSVVKKTYNQNTKKVDDNKKMDLQCQQFENTLFDGQSFGQPDNKSDQQCNYEVISSEKVLLMRFPYLDFCKIYKENSNLEERINLLSSIFGKVPGCRPAKNESLQDLALEMQTLKYSAKQIIFRKGDPCEKLIIVASGAVFMTDQHILIREKKICNDLKKRSKSERRVNMKDFSIQTLRRKNLKKYQIIHQNQEQFVFYYQDIKKQLGYGDAINWQGFCYRQLQNITVQNSFVAESQMVGPSKDQENPFRINYSLISQADNTQIYLIDMKKLRKLPDSIKQVINTKINLALSEAEKESQTQNENHKYNSIKKWDKFKQQICNQIVNKRFKV